MNPANDQIIARRLLETRDRGMTFGLFLRRNTRRYLLLVGAYGWILVMIAIYQRWLPFCFVLGLLGGILLRDLAWMRLSRAAWPLMAKVIDWEKVRRLAENRAVV